MVTVKTTLGANIRRFRKAKGLTLEELAQVVNITRQTASKYERGIIPNIPADKIERIAHVLDTTPATLFGWDNTSEELQYNIEDQGADMSSEKAINKEFGHRVHHIRKTQGLTLKELAALVGLTEGNVQRYETGQINRVSLDIIERFAAALGVSPSELVGWTSADGVKPYRFAPKIAALALLVEAREELRELIAEAATLPAEDVGAVIALVKHMKKRYE